MTLPTLHDTLASVFGSGSSTSSYVTLSRNILFDRSGEPRVGEEGCGGGWEVAHLFDGLECVERGSGWEDPRKGGDVGEGERNRVFRQQKKQEPE